MARVTGLLHERGARMTTPRARVLGVLAGRVDPLSISQVADAVSEPRAGVHRATVYRTLETLAGLGAVERVALGGGPVRYRLAATTVHPVSPVTVTCASCRSVEELPPGVLVPLLRSVSAHTRFVLDVDAVRLTGTCSNCDVLAPEG